MLRFNDQTFQAFTFQPYFAMYICYFEVWYLIDFLNNECSILYNMLINLLGLNNHASCTYGF
jgi:hypothetical protein